METNVLVFASSLSFRPLLRPDLVKFSVFGCFVSVLLLSAGWSRHGGRGSPALPVAVCPPFGLEHRPPGDSPSLLSPPLFFSGQCFPLVVSVLLRCSSALAVLLGSLAFVSVLLGMVVYGGIFFFIQPRPELTRAHAWGLFLLFPASLPSAGLLVAFFFGGRCWGIPSTPGKRGGAFLSVFYISGGIVKNPHGHKISTAGAVLVPSWRCWFGLLRLSVPGQVVTISAGLGLPWKSPAHA